MQQDPSGVARCRRGIGTPRRCCSSCCCANHLAGEEVLGGRVPAAGGDCRRAGILRGLVSVEGARKAWMGRYCEISEIWCKVDLGGGGVP